MDYYEVLSIGRDATNADIRHAYMTLARKHHPDKNFLEGRLGAERRFKKIGEAYATLSDPCKRCRYDLQCWIAAWQPGEQQPRDDQAASMLHGANWRVEHHIVRSDAGGRDCQQIALEAGREFCVICRKQMQSVAMCYNT